MPDLEVSLAVAPSALTEPLLNGEVVPEGITLRLRKTSVEENSSRFPQVDCDVTEVEISTLVKAIEDEAPFRALPLFTSGRHFVHSGIWFRFRREVSLQSLRGKIAIATRYWSPSVIWQRKILGMTYGVQAEDISWVTLQPELVDASLPHQILSRLETLGRSAEELASTG
ncbi:MAG TPA: hypothetical protein VGK54_00735, partial [Chloroflexota bacterium]